MDTNSQITSEKAALYLKLGRKLAVFVKADVFFESETFDWVLLEKHKNGFRAKLIRSLNQGDEVFTDVLSFETVNDLDPESDASSDSFLSDDLNKCLDWIKSAYRLDKIEITTPEKLSEIYAELLKNGTFGN
ncbi:hypothetical protein [Flavobacterium sp.]|uniref:hypothetical protein n=1 Tax=Flavobacterium sp. TaxID=239 RepID=UPI001211914E|nr:hypothetical protein [Flavobacterium sp.]RZJ69552.1 MAG: hypothetical protein EOO49_17175 [Flavobacterium sp.]